MIEIKALSKTVSNKSSSIELPYSGLVCFEGQTQDLFNELIGLKNNNEFEIILDGKSNSNLSKKEFENYKKDIAVINKSILELLDKTVKEILLMSLDVQGNKLNKSKVIDYTLSKTDLKDSSSKKIFELTNEQKERLLIASSIVRNPKFIVVPKEISNSISKETVKTLESISANFLILLFCDKENFVYPSNCIRIKIKNGQLEEVPQNYSFDKKQSKREENKRTFLSKLYGVISLSLHNLASKPFKLISSVLIAFISISLFGIFSSLESFDKNKAASKAILQNKEDYLSVQYRKTKSYLMHDENLDYLNKNYGLNSNGVINHGRAIYFLTDSINVDQVSLKKSYTNYINYFFKQTALNFFPISDLNILPSSYKLLSGTLPKDKNEVMITDYQYEFFKLFGYQYKRNNVIDSLSPEDIKDPESLIGKNIYGSTYKDLKISGILDTSFDLNLYQPFLNYLDYEAYDNDTAPENIKGLYHQLDHDLDYSYINLLYINPDLGEEIKASNDYYQIKDGYDDFYFGKDQPLKEENKFTKIYNDKDEDISLLDDKFEKDSLILPISTYMNSLNGNNLIDKTEKEFTIPKEYIYNETQDLKITDSPYDFFSTIEKYGIAYVADKTGVNDFNSQKFDTIKYTKDYYGSKNMSVPSSISDEDKKEIFSLFLKENLYNYDYWIDEYTKTLRDEANSINNALLTYLLKTYKDTYFTNRSLELRIKESFGSETFQSFNFNLAGLSLSGSKYISKEKAKEVCEDVDSFYSLAITPKPKDEKILARIVSLNFNLDDEETRKASPYFITADEITDVKDLDNSLNITKYVILAFAIITALTGIAVLINYLNYALAKNEDYLNTLRNFGATTKDLSMIALLDNSIMLLASFILSIPMFFISIAILKNNFFGHNELSSALNAGGNQIGIMVAVAILPFLISVVIPLININKRSKNK